MKTLGPGFLAEFKKHKSLQAAVQESLASGKSQSHGTQSRTPGNSKKPLKNTSTPKLSKKDGSALSRPSSSSSKTDEALQKKELEKEEDSAAGSSKAHPASYNRLLREDLLSCGTVLHISDLPEDGFSDQDIKKIVQPFGKVSDLIVLRSRNEVSPASGKAGKGKNFPGIPAGNACKWQRISGPTANSGILYG
ncbi:PREDICTED: zinc finger protein 638-like [Corvus brachyrhynchos]|uniref:zinc finger protein 638-like n=1 Tax=Corvus brachyrhynchos TaxID=85066 RepID=UPI00081636F4|nr:PREDICTED: zinc finger protein 638-like [Corvus brachyrhynchos]